MDKAIEHLAISYKKTGHNTKPVILHSIRVGLKLFDKGYSEDIVLAGILHDIVEDTETSIEDVEIIFGTKIAQIVLATSFNKEITDKHAMKTCFVDALIRAMKHY